MNPPEIKYTVADPAALLARADNVFYDCHVENWESLRGPPLATVQECEARLIVFAGAAVLDDGSLGPAPYASWGVDPDQP